MIGIGCAVDVALRSDKQYHPTKACRLLMSTRNTLSQANKGLARPLRLHGRVVLALMLRDIKTRMGGSYFGFVFGLILPLGHLGIVLAVYLMMGRRAALGTDATRYLTSAILPFIIWSYTHQKVLQAFAQNIPLMSFPIVRMIDILVARSLVELLNSAIIIIIVIITISIIGSDIFIYDRSLALLSVLLAYLFGVSTGYFFGIIGQIFQTLTLVGFLLIPLNWVVCGIFFIPEALPDQMRSVISWFPMSHIVDIARLAVFPTYLSTFSRVDFVLTIALGNIFLTISIERLARTKILSA